MIRYLPLIAITLFCSSCRIHQVNLLKSEVEHAAEEPFTFDNDSIKVQYSFNGGNVEISISNKTEQPFYVDWNASALIANDEAFSYFGGTSEVKLKTRKIEYGYGFSRSRTWGTINNPRPVPVSTIPPKSKIRNVSINLSRLTPFFGDGQKLRSGVYTRESSPLKLRSYLTLSLSRDFSKTIQLDHPFWVAEMRQYDAKQPKNHRPDIYESTNRRKNR